MNSLKSCFWRFLGLIVAATMLASCSVIQSVTGGTGGSASNTSTAASLGTVKAITAVTSVTASGSTEALQTIDVSWKTTGLVGTVNVKAGDKVKAGDVLMAIDPASAGTAQIEAQATLSSAVKALDELLNPTALEVANAQKAVSDAQTNLDNLLTPTDTAVAAAKQAVADAQSTLQTAQKTLASSKSTNLAYYQDQVNQAQDALTNAQQNATVTDIGSLPVQLRQAQSDLERATNVYNNAKDAFAKCPACTTVWAYDRMTDWATAQNLYNDAVNKVNQIQIQIDQAQRSNTQSVVSAQSDLTTAQSNLKAAAAGPSTVTVSVNEAAVLVAQAALKDAQTNLNDVQNPTATTIAVAKATLSDAQDTLAKLTNPDPTDVVNAQAKVAAAQDAVDAYTLKAPVDGEVLAVNFQPGDMASTSGAAVTLGNRDHIRVEVAVDESDVGKIKVGNPVTITMDALTDVALPATVTWVNPTGTTTSGLVKYTVQVDSTKTDPQVLLGMSATAQIVTSTKVGQLAVPLAAVLYDTQGEYVYRLKTDGTFERVTVKSGDVQNGLVFVEGTLAAGDQVSLTATSSTTTASSSSNNAGGAGGLGGLTGGPSEPPSGGAPQP